MKAGPGGSNPPKKHNYPKERKPGGPRPMAGRPATLKDPVRVTIWLEAEQLAWIKAQGRILSLSKGELSEVIRRLIDEARVMAGNGL